MILLGCFSCEGHTVLRLQWLMGMVGQAVTNWFQARLIERAETKQRSLVDALTLVKALDETNSESQAAMVVVNQVRRLCHADQVALTMAGKLVGVSDVEQIDTNNEANKILESACNQAVVARGINPLVGGNRRIQPPPSATGRLPSCQPRRSLLERPFDHR